MGKMEPSLCTVTVSRISLLLVILFISVGLQLVSRFCQNIPALTELDVHSLISKMWAALKTWIHPSLFGPTCHQHYRQCSAPHHQPWTRLSKNEMAKARKQTSGYLFVCSCLNWAAVIGWLLISEILCSNVWHFVTKMSSVSGVSTTGIKCDFGFS